MMGAFLLFCSLKANNMIYSDRQLISKNSFFMAILQWLQRLVQHNEDNNFIFFMYLL